MFNWLKELLELRLDYNRQKLICDSCEILKRQLEIRNHEYEQLLESLLKKPEPIINQPPIEISKPKMVPWNIRRQMLEADDRKKAELMKSAPKPLLNTNEIPTMEELEKELGVDSALSGSNAEV